MLRYTDKLMAFIKQYRGLFSLTLMSAVINVDFTAVNLALPKIVSSFGVPLSQGQQMLSLYLFAASAFFILGGKLIDVYSKRCIYLLGVTLFGLSSFLITIVDSFTVFSVLRLMQGIGYAFVFPTAMLLADHMIPGHRKFTGISLIIFVSTLSQALGPSLAGVILDFWGWKSIFYINIGVSLSAYGLFQGLLFDNTSVSSKKFDLRGCFLFYGLFSVGAMLISQSFSPYITAFGYVIGGLMVYALYRHVLQNKDPFVNLMLFKNSVFVQSCVLRMLFNICWAFIVVYPPIFLQIAQGYTAKMTSLIIIVFTLISAVTTAYADRVTKHFGQSRMLSGSFLLILGAHGITVAFNIDLSVVYLVLTLVFYGISCGLVLPILTKITVESLDENTKGQGLGIFYTLSLIAMGVGSYVLGEIMDKISAHSMTIHAIPEGGDQAHIIRGSQSLYDLHGQISMTNFSDLQLILQKNHQSIWFILSEICFICLIGSVLICWQMKKKSERILSDSVAEV